MLKQFVFNRVIEAVIRWLNSLGVRKSTPPLEVRDLPKPKPRPGHNYGGGGPPRHR